MEKTVAFFLHSSFCILRSAFRVTTRQPRIRNALPITLLSTGTHEQFIIRLSSQNLTVEIEHNISVGARAPIAEGDRVIVHGEYVWNSKGGLIHFTHHDPQGTHEGGYIEDNGRTYD